MNLDFHKLTSEELKFWKKFKQEDIFEWLSGSPIHPPDYNEYIRIRSLCDDPLPAQPLQQPPIQPPQQNQQPGPAVRNQVPQLSPRKPGRLPGSKNKPKDPLMRAAHYMSKRFTRAASRVFSRTQLGRMLTHLSSFLIISFTMGGIQAGPLFNFLPPVIIDENQQINTNNNAHTTIFFPIDKYAMDVHYQIICIPINLTPVEQRLKQCGKVLHHMNNAIRGKSTEIPIRNIIRFHNKTLDQLNSDYDNMLKNPREAPFTLYGSRKKRFLNLLFGFAGTAFGVSNTIEIARINSIIAKEIHRTDMLVDISQLYENLLYNLDIMINKTGLDRFHDSSIPPISGFGYIS